MKTQKYIRKPMYVEAVQVTAENLLQVMKWCGGTAFDQFEGPAFIKVLGYRSKLLPTKAFVGDWVLSGPHGFRVYSDTAFKKTFEQVPEVIGEWPVSLEEAQLTIQFTEKEDADGSDGR